MPRRLRLLWVVPYLPLRGVTAARERFWHLLARLAPRHDLTLLAFVDAEDAGREHELPPGLASVHLLAKAPYRPHDPLALLPRTVAGGYTDPALAAAIGAHLAAGRWDVVQYELSETTELIPARAARAILTVHQIGFAQEGPAWRASGAALGRGAVFLHRYLRELDFELRAIRRVDHVVTMSAEDAARLRRFAPDLSLSVSPCGVDCRAFRPVEPPPPRESDLLFVGHFGHPPNVDAVRFLVEQIVPRLGPVRVRIVGRGVTPEVSRLARPGVEVAGAVDDVRPTLAAAGVFVAPVRFGTGMRGKVLEALAMGRPVVTTALGSEGLGAKPGRDLLIAERADDFARAIRRVLDDPGLAAGLGAAGRALVAARFDWDPIAAAHDAIYEEVLQTPARAALDDRSPGALVALAERLGWAPGVALGCGVLAARALRWHARRLTRAHPPALARTPAALEA